MKHIKLFEEYKYFKGSNNSTQFKTSTMRDPDVF